MDVDKRLRVLKRRSDRINAVKILQNSILANGCYSEKEEKLQFDKANALGNLTDCEARLIKKAWRFRKKETAILADELEEILTEVEYDGKKENRDQ